MQSKTSNTHSTSGCCLQWEEGTISIPFPAKWLRSRHGYLGSSAIMETQHRRGHAKFLATLCQNIPDIGVWIIWHPSLLKLDCENKQVVCFINMTQHQHKNRRSSEWCK